MNSLTRLRIVILLLLVTVVGAFLALGGQHYLSLASLREGLIELQRWRAAHPLAAALGFSAVYVLVTALSLPGATAMTLAGGALFGAIWGTVVVSFASSLGALLAFLLTRYLLRELVDKKFGTQLQTIHRGLERDGAYYLFSVRLVPILPFFLVNLLFGLTRMRAWTFYWVSQVGMLAATVVYVHAGTQLAAVAEPRDLFSPRLLGAFTLVAILPWCARIALRGRERWRLRRP